MFNQSRRLPWMTIAVVVAAALSPAQQAVAAEAYKVGDKIEVFFLREWYPAVVVATNKRGEVGAEFEFAGGAKRDIFKQAEVRYAFESGAMTRGRMWSDPSGKFRTKAALLKINDDESITIRKEDMAEVKIPLKTLSEGDQKYVKSLQKEGGVATFIPPEPPPLEDFESGAFGTFGIPFAGSGAQREPLTPDPLPAYLKIKQGGAAFPLDDFFDKLGTVLPLGGPDAWILATMESSSPTSGLPTRILWASLVKQKIEGRQLLPVGEIVLDYHPPTRRLLTLNNLKDGQPGWGTPALTLWEVSPADKKVKPVVRWKADSGEGGLHEPWARLIDGNLVVQRYKKQEYVCWDAAAKQVKYRLNQESFFAPLVSFSGGRKQLFLPEDNGVRVIESATGKHLLSLPSANGVSGVAISEDGRRAAVLEDYVLAVWDLTDPSAEPQRYQAEAIGTPFTADLFWVGPERVMADKGGFGQVLFSLKTRLALWNYHFDHNAVREHGSQRMREIVDQHLVYAATVGNGPQRGLAVGAVQLPGPKVNEVEAATDPESLLLMKPGSEVRFEIQTGENDAKVRAALEAEIQKNGWVHSESASAVLIAEMKRGETQSVTYDLGGFGRPQRQESVSITPFISSLHLKLGDQIVWSSGTSSGAPPFVRLPEGQSLQGEVTRWQNPDPDFFGRVDIPDKLLDPAKRNGLGTTEVTNRGLIAK